MEKRDLRIQLIRIVAMSLIIVCHLCTCSTNSILSSLGLFFDVGVFIFFLISGFLYGDKNIENTKEWLKKRLAVILIPMYIFVLLLIWINITTGTINILQTIPYLFNMQYFYGGIQGGGHLWFISVIMICYLLLPIMNKYKNVIKDKKISIIIIVAILSLVIGLFSKKIGLLGFYILTFYIGYLMKNYKEKVFNISYVKAFISILFAITIRLLGKVIFDDTLFYETTITGMTHLIMSLSMFVVIYKYVSKLQIKCEKIINVINKIDIQSYNIFIVHYMYIVGPLKMLDITSIGLINIGIFVLITVISAKALSILVDYVKKLFYTIMNFKLKKSRIIVSVQIIEVFLIVAYKYLLAYNYRNNIILYTIALLSGISCLIVCCFKIGKYKKKDILIMILLGLLSAVSVVLLRSVNLVFPLMIAMTFYNETYKKICKTFFWALLIGFGITIVLNTINVLPDHNLSRLINGRSWIRYGLGFMNPAFVMLYYVFIVLAGYCAFGYTKKFAILSNFGTIILYGLSLSRTALLCLVILNVIVLVESKLKIIEKILRSLVPYIYGLLVILLVGVTILSTHMKIGPLNYLLSGRLEFNQEFYNRGYFNTLFGVREILDLPLDNYYLYPLVKLGIVGCIIYTLLNYVSLSRLRNNKEIIIVQIIVFLYGMGDTNVIVSSINFIMPIQVLALINNENKYILGDNRKYEK